MQSASAAGKNQVGAPSFTRHPAQFVKKFNGVVCHCQHSLISNARRSPYSFVSALTCNDVPQNVATIIIPDDSDRSAVSHRQRSVSIFVAHH
jgi:hypothetical protein